MNSEEFLSYLNDRYEEQLSWYNGNAAKQKQYYVLFQWSAIVLSALLPVLVVSLSELARELSVDLVVMGTVARTGIDGFFMGNTAEGIHLLFAKL